MSELTWKELNSQQQIDEFMENMDYFHDGCIKELRFVSGAYVNVDLSMMPVNTCRTVYLVIQRQYEDPSAVEIRFEGVEWLSLKPANEKYTCEIFGAHMCIEGDMIVWFDSDNFKESYTELYKEDVTLVKAHKVYWREADELLGEEPVYGIVR